MPRGNYTIRYPGDLPITAHREAILGLLKQHRVVIIAGETGSGKTTQIPKICLEAGLAEKGAIVCTQPRRVAALSISKRIAEELEVPWGETVGAKIRFTDKTSRHTLIKVMTDGMLLAEIQRDPDLRRYAVIVIDEAHERSLNIDFLLGYLKNLLSRRRDLKLVVTSATIDTAAFSRAFDNAPILEVSGRLYPVETRYQPIDEWLEESGDVTFVDAVCRAVESILGENRPGDVLVFLPGEKDIREVRALLQKKGPPGIEVLPLFGRLTASEQDRIFSPSRQRKVILSTNIAETSITIPGIRYVIDTGLARISRYSAHTHTRRLPIEKIARSSADQRKGRAGRLSDGVCIRLYSEADFLSRPAFGIPEILRSNLADVILRMIAFRIGDIRTFPFIDSPSERAIRSGFDLLAQLGAIDEAHLLTPLGQELAHLPVDPTVGRMLLEARREGCVRELLVIAAGLSIQDPRERPMEQATQADTMHRQFQHPESDFLTLLNIWDAFHDELERLSQNQVRKFCKEHYLSYIRMREWRDIHAQLERALRELEAFHLNAQPAEYDQIHRALLSGLLSGVAQLETDNTYRATRSRTAHLFPGSTLFRKTARDRKSGKPKPVPKGTPGANWILCAEFMETSRLFARTAARIDPRWIARLGEHVLKRKYSDPLYDEDGERVLVRERLLLYGLEVSSQRVAYRRIDPAKATEIFIREALVANRLKTRLGFHEANWERIEHLRERQTRLRLGSGWELDEALFRFYAARLHHVASLGDLKAFLRDLHGGKESVLLASEEDLQTEALPEGDEAFPEMARFAGQSLPIDYVYRPGEAEDGATLKVPVEAFESVNPHQLDWLVPGYIEKRIDHLLRGLPKEIRRQLIPIGEVAKELSFEVRPSDGPLTDQLARLLDSSRGLRVCAADWKTDGIPDWLRPRLQVYDQNNKVIAAGRDWDQVNAQYKEALRQSLETGAGPDALAIWKTGQARHERPNLRPEDLPDLPEWIHLGDVAGLPVRAWPGLIHRDGVHLRLFPSLEKAANATPSGFQALCEEALGREIGWLQRDLSKDIRRAALGYAWLMDSSTLGAETWALLRRHLLRCEQPLPLRSATLESVTQRFREESRGIVPRVVDLLVEIAAKRDQVATLSGSIAAWQAELDSLVHRRFLQELDLSQLFHYPRYLEGLRVRIERARVSPQKDLEKARQLLPFIREYLSLKVPARDKEPLRWLIEEFKIQLFAQELKTPRKVSPKVIESMIVALRNKGLKPASPAAHTR
jgi:ATP-dependent helicase HrpA